MTHSDSLQALPDILQTNPAVVFCGINPGLLASSTGHHFAGRGKRFWSTLYLAGFTPEQLRPEDDRTLLQYGCGLAAGVSRPTARADELSPKEFKTVAVDFEQEIERYAPRCVAFLGKMAISGMSGTRDIDWGPQPTLFG